MKKIYIIIIVLVLAIVSGVVAWPRKSLSPAEPIGTTKQTSMNISSKEFQNNGAIPAKFTCQGENINPELKISGVPAEAESLALIMDDPDIPDFVKQARGIQVFDHWVAFNIPPNVTEIKEGTEPEGIAGLNGSGETGYTGPCPPDREHRYFFKLYALDAMLDLPAGSKKENVEKAMAGRVLEQAQLIGTYVKK